tara:strand:- start:682 stop:1887 length:1206 start_codon:yes stop_codon:yes gene_type:complete
MFLSFGLDIIYTMMNITPFTDYIIEQDEKQRVDTTGHMYHAGDLLYAGDPDSAIEHSRAMLNRFNGLHTAGHEGYLKVDGGMSIVMGVDEDARPFVSYKSAKERFYDHEAIAATGKDHYVNALSPALDAVSSMDYMDPGTAIQADFLHNSEHTDRVYRSNPSGIIYRTNPSAKGKFAFAPHSRYEVKGSDLIRVGNDIDHDKIKSPMVHAPQLSLADKEFNLSPYRRDSIAQHIATAEELLQDETTRDFAASIPEDKNFHGLIQGYSNLIARTTGKRSVEDLKDFVGDYVGRTRPESTRAKWAGKYMERINNNSTQLDNLFTAHHHINHAKHHLLDSHRGNHDQYEITPHGADEHEGLVSHLEGKTSAKFVREGPGGFAAKNAQRKTLESGQAMSATVPPA